MAALNTNLPKPVPSLVNAPVPLIIPVTLIAPDVAVDVIPNVIPPVFVIPPDPIVKSPFASLLILVEVPDKAVIAPFKVALLEACICLIAPGVPVTPLPFALIISGTVIAAAPFNSKVAPSLIVVEE